MIVYELLASISHVSNPYDINKQFNSYIKPQPNHK